MTARTTRPADPGTWTRIDRCRACGASDLEVVLDLGEVPLADVFPTAAEAAADLDPVYPLTVGFCPSCSLLQTREDVPARDLFDDRYLYRSSASADLVARAAGHVDTLVAARGLGPDHTVVELASNDGYLLQHVVAAGIGAVGIDPVAALAAEARTRGVATIERFFDRDVATDLRRDGIRADVIVANNVFAHVEDLASVCDGMRLLLADTGTIRIEVPWVRSLVEGLAFDTTYHEHRSHFGVASLVPLFERHGLVLTHVDHLDVHGGSLRLHVDPLGEPDRTVTDAIAAEDEAGLVDGAGYATFADRVARALDRLRDLVDDTVAAHGPMAGYGAAAKGTVLANVAGLTPDDVAWVVDRNTAKHGRLVPGLRAPIRPVSALADDRPPVVLLFAWNHAAEVRREQAPHLAGGGRFLVPLPSPCLDPA